MKKMLALLLALLALTMTAAMADEMYEVEWNEGGTCLIVSYDGPGGDVVIPEEIDGGEVVGICGYSFQGNHEITSVVIPEGVDWIGPEAFYGCDYLESVQLPSTLTNIGDQAFAYCFALKEINLHSGVEYIGEEVFGGCSQLVLDAEELEIYENHGAVKTATGENVELAGFLGGSLQDLMDVTGTMEMTPESWRAYDGATYMNDTAIAFTLDGETVAGVGAMAGSNFSVKDVRCDMTVDEISGILESHGYSMTYSDDYFTEFSNGNEYERITIDIYEGRITRIFMGWNG